MRTLGTPREMTVEAGVAARFEHPRATRWIFGDGAVVNRTATNHVFAMPGHYDVRVYARDELLESISVVVEPRAVMHAIPPGPDWFVALRTTDDLIPLVDFFERLAGASTTQQVLEAWPAWAFALDSQGLPSLDPAEGCAAFALPDSNVLVSLVGVSDGSAVERFGTWLVDHGWSALSERAFQREGGERLEVVFDRGSLYALVGPDQPELTRVAGRITHAPAAGLQATTLAGPLDGLATGSVVLYARGSEAVSWQHALAAVSLAGTRAIARGAIVAPAPLWPIDRPVPSLLRHAADGAIASVASALSTAQLLSLVDPRSRQGLVAWLAQRGLNVEDTLAAIEGPFSAAAWFDVDAFVRRTLANDGKPTPAGTLMLEAAVTDPSLVGRLIDGAVEHLRLPLQPRRERDTRRWVGSVGLNPVDLAVTPRALLLTFGTRLDHRPTSDLTTFNFEEPGAFGPGHLTAALDLGELRRELRVPHDFSGLDPRRALTAQSLAVTFVDRFTALDTFAIDFAATPTGARLEARLTLSPRAELAP